MYIAALNDFSDAQSNPCLAKSSFVSSSEVVYDSKVLKSKGLAPFSVKYTSYSQNWAACIGNWEYPFFLSKEFHLDMEAA